MEEFESFVSKLNALGESEVRLRLANGSFGERKKPLVEDWLRSLEASRNNSLAEEKSSREERKIANAEEANSIAREALSNSRLATRIAISAIILSISMAILEIIKYYQ